MFQQREGLICTKYQHNTRIPDVSRHKCERVTFSVPIQFKRHLHQQILPFPGAIVLDHLWISLGIDNNLTIACPLEQGNPSFEHNSARFQPVLHIKAVVNGVKTTCRQLCTISLDCLLVYCSKNSVDNCWLFQCSKVLMKDTDCSGSPSNMVVCLWKKN